MTTTVKHTFHFCVGGRQGVGAREDCPKCNPQAARFNVVIVKQAKEIAELKALLRETVTSIEFDELGLRDLYERIQRTIVKDKVQA